MRHRNRPRPFPETEPNEKAPMPIGGRGAFETFGGSAMTQEPYSSRASAISSVMSMVW